jgi:hypothetical protein
MMALRSNPAAQDVMATTEERIVIECNFHASKIAPDCSGIAIKRLL